MFELGAEGSGGKVDSGNFLLRPLRIFPLRIPTQGQGKLVISKPSKCMALIMFVFHRFQTADLFLLSNLSLGRTLIRHMLVQGPIKFIFATVFVLYCPLRTMQKTHFPTFLSSLALAFL